MEELGAPWLVMGPENLAKLGFSPFVRVRVAHQCTELSVEGVSSGQFPREMTASWSLRGGGLPYGHVALAP